MSQDLAFTKLFPTWYKLPPREQTYQQEIIINWLEIECEQHLTHRLPALEHLSRWRNRDVYNYVRFEGSDWTIGACRRNAAHHHR